MQVNVISRIDDSSRNKKYSPGTSTKVRFGTSLLRTLRTMGSALTDLVLAPRSRSVSASISARTLRKSSNTCAVAVRAQLWSQWVGIAYSSRVEKKERRSVGSTRRGGEYVSGVSGGGAPRRVCVGTSRCPSRRRPRSAAGGRGAGACISPRLWVKSRDRR